MLQLSINPPTRVHLNDVVELIDYFHRVEAPRHRDGQHLLAHWQACMAKGDGFILGRDMPARAIAGLLRSVVVYEPLADESDMTVRLAGEMAQRRFGGEIKGARMSELFPRHDFEHHLKASLEVLATNRPVVMDSSLRRGSIEDLHAEVLLLPATAFDRKSKWLLVGLFYFE